MIQVIALSAVALSAATYLALGINGYSKTKALRDHLPVDQAGEARVAGAREFGSATVAASVSLATVILAFTELAGVFGPWLLWSGFTTAMGLAVLRRLSPAIWRRISGFGEGRLSVHAFLGQAFRSRLLVRTSALCTTLGFVGALAVELTVGSRFLASLMPLINPQAAVVVLAAVGILYTLLGGFRVVIRTDRIQMAFIWIAIAALAMLVLLRISGPGARSELDVLTRSISDFSWREGLGPFLIGIFLLNVPTFIADMSLWQRIAGTRSLVDLRAGLSRSVFAAASSWSALALLACCIVAVTPQSGEANALALFLRRALDPGTILGAALVFLVTVGLYAANLSTASTQLIAAGQAAQVDLARAGKLGDEFKASASGLRQARLLVVGLGTCSVVAVELLTSVGFNISDLVFALYGSQLGMVPAVLIALFGDEAANRNRGPLVASAVTGGFVVGWFGATCGKILGNENLVFLSPLLSLALSSLISALALLRRADR